MTQAQKLAKAKFKQAIAYRQKSGVSLKEAFAHIYGKKKVVKKTAKKVAKKLVKKVVSKKPTKYKSKLSNKWKAIKSTDNVSELKKYGYQIKGVKDSALVKKELAKKGLKMPHGYATIKRKRKISGVKKKKPTEQGILNKIHIVKRNVDKLDEAQHKHMMGATKISFDKLEKAISNAIYYKKIIDNINKEIISKKGFPAYIIKDLKNTKKTFSDMLKEEKIHITQLKKFIK